MHKAYTRKFLIKNLPNIDIETEVINKRYYLYSKSGIILRIQSIGDVYEFERKVDKSTLIKESLKIEITQDEFEKLITVAINQIERRTITYSNHPHIKVRFYEGKYKGLIRVEVNFVSEAEANAFLPYEWFGNEITVTPLAKDATLLQLTPEEFDSLLAQARN